MRNVKLAFFGQHAENISSYCLMQSIDDKAYLCPGTSEGFSNARNQRILTMTDAEKVESCLNMTGQKIWSIIHLEPIVFLQKLLLCLI